MQWKGPFKVLEKVEGPEYRIHLERKQKIFHANLLKRYLPANFEDPEVAPEPTELGEVSEN